MRFRYLGTGACEGVPSVFCSCRVCEESRRRGGDNLRTRSEALINKDLMIDFNADTRTNALRYGINLGNLNYILITHSHMDHLYPGEFENLRTDFSLLQNEHSIHLFVGEDGYKRMKALMTEIPNLDTRLELHLVRPGDSFQMGDYRVSVYQADHDPTATSLFYSIEDSMGKSVLYAHDTGIFPEETWKALKKRKKPFSMVSLDCTFMDMHTPGQNHMCLDNCIQVRDRFYELGIADENTIFVVNHFTHNAGKTHQEFAPIAEREGFLAAYDGLEFTL